MKIYTKITDIKNKYKKIVVALGMFDGMHIGHQSIVHRAMELAEGMDGQCVVFTFSNHPLSVVAPERMPLQIGSPDLRNAILERMGVEVVFNISFTKEFSRISPNKFMEILQDNLAPLYVVTGANFTFGYQGKGNQRLLMRAGKDYGFCAEICPTILDCGRAISSTRIRELLKNGELPVVNEFLGRPFTFLGRVVHGDRRGRTLGFPTANLMIPDYCAMLPNGVYAVRVLYDEKIYDGVANIGNNPTFEGCYHRLEVHILDFQKDIYDKPLHVFFLQKLRDEKKFNSAEHLVKQLHKDKMAATAICNEWKSS